MTDQLATLPPPAKKFRVESIDAFRGFTIFSMIFVIMVAGYHNLPLTFPQFDSAPVSTFKHAGEDADAEEWAFWEGADKSSTYRAATVESRDGDLYSVTVPPLDESGTTETFSAASIRHARPLNPGEKAIAVYDTGGDPRFIGPGNGCTFTDWVAPFFVFIVGMCIPLSRQRRGGEWWWHVGSRTLMLIVAGIVYISLILKVSYWWGILQAIGLAYCMGAVAMQLPWQARLVALLAVAEAHGFMIGNFRWWTTIGDPSRPFLTIANLQGDPLRPLTVHCTPWASVGYGVMTVIGTLLGQAIATKSRPNIVKASLVIGIAFMALGWIEHEYLIPMNKDCVTQSYAYFTSGLGALIFLLFYLIIDVAGFKGWAYVFTVFGANALLAYFLQPVVRIFFQALGLYPWFTGHAGWNGVAWGLAWTMVLWSVTWWCNRRNIYWKL